MSSRVVTFRGLPYPRRYVATSPPSSGQPPPKNTNNVILFAVGAATAVGAYYYMRNQPSEELSAKVKRDQEVMAQKARESLATGKARADDASKQVEQKYEGKRKAVDDKVGATRGTVEQTLHDAESRARGLSSDAKLRYDSYRDSAGDALSKTRSSVGKMYDDTKSATEQKISSVCSEVGKQEDNVRQGWFSWLRWSKSEAEKGERRLEDAKKTAASEVARAAEDVRQRAEKHT